MSCFGDGGTLKIQESRPAIPRPTLIEGFSRVRPVFWENDMTKKATLPPPEVCFTMKQSPDEVRGILWAIARDPEQSGTAGFSACRLLLMDAREGDEEGETRHDADLNKRALALMPRVAN
jgi:hypothetical protein